MKRNAPLFRCICVACAGSSKTKKLVFCALLGFLCKACDSGTTVSVQYWNSWPCASCAINVTSQSYKQAQSQMKQWFMWSGNARVVKFQRLISIPPIQCHYSFWYSTFFPTAYQSWDNYFNLTDVQVKVFLQISISCRIFSDVFFTLLKHLSDTIVSSLFNLHYMSHMRSDVWSQSI